MQRHSNKMQKSINKFKMKLIMIVGNIILDNYNSIKFTIYIEIIKKKQYLK